MRNKVLVFSALFLMMFSITASAESTYSLQDVNEHSVPENCWMIFDDGIYDLSSYLPNHDIYMDIRDWCGNDMTEDFMTKAGEGVDHKPFSYALLEDYYIGVYDATAVADTRIEEDHEEEYLVEISGQEFKVLTVQEVADLWNIDAKDYLVALKKEFNLVGEYTVDSVIDTLRDEYKFSPSQAKEVAQEAAIPSGVVTNGDLPVSPENPYNFIVPFLLSIVTYTVWFLLTKTSLNKKSRIFTRVFFNMFWNSVLLFAVTIPGLIFGFLMVIKYSKPKLVDIFDYEFIYYWHVELSVVMATIALAHFVNRFVLYRNQLKISFKKNKKA